MVFSNSSMVFSLSSIVISFSCINLPDIATPLIIIPSSFPDLIVSPLNTTAPVVKIIRSEFPAKSLCPLTFPLSYGVLLKAISLGPNLSSFVQILCGLCQFLFDSCPAKCLGMICCVNSTVYRPPLGNEQAPFLQTFTSLKIRNNYAMYLRCNEWHQAHVRLIWINNY